MPKKATVKKTAASAPKKAVKKATKKTAVKRAAATKKATQKDAKLLVCAPDDKCFWTTDGHILKNLEDLKLAFGTMADEVFLHHVNSEKNDFADWVEQVLEDAKCAAALRKSKKPTTAKTVVIKHLRHYHV